MEYKGGKRETMSSSYSGCTRKDSYLCLLCTHQPLQWKGFVKPTKMERFEGVVWFT